MQNRNSNGQYARKGTMFFASLMLAGLAAVMFFGFAPKFDKWYNAQTEIVAVAAPFVAAIPKAEAAETLESKFAKTKAELVDSLGLLCETRGAKEADAVIILDSNNEMSIGAFQWQIKSVIHYYKQLYGKDITRVEAIQVAIDHTKSKELTTDVLFKVPGGWKNWSICAQKLDLPVQIELLNRIEK